MMKAIQKTIRKHKYKYKHNEKDNEKEIDTDKVPEIPSICYIFDIVMTHSFRT